MKQEAKITSILTQIASNWQKESKYSFVLDCSYERLAWEFLRRNKTYINDYLKNIEPFLRAHNSTWAIDNPLTLIPEQSILYYTFWSKDKLDERESYKSWKLQNWLNPVQSEPSHFWIGPLGNIVISHDIGNTKKNNQPRILEVSNNNIGILINITKPINSQLNHYAEQLSALQKTLKKISASKDTNFIPRKNSTSRTALIKYLRILDAINLGIKDTKAFEKIYSNEESADDSTYRKAKKRANKLTEEYQSFLQ